MSDVNIRGTQVKLVLEIVLLVLQLFCKSKIISKYRILRYPLQRVEIDLFTSLIFFPFRNYRHDIL